MKKKDVVNLPVSTAALLNLATERKEEFSSVLSRYGLERFQPMQSQTCGVFSPTHR